MTTIAHALSAGLIAVTAARANPAEGGYIAAALVAGAIVDLDHIYPVLKNWRHYRQHGFRGNLHGARTPFHEMPGLIIVASAACLVWLADPMLAFVVFTAFTVHLAQDFVLGRSLPFSPFDRTEVQMFKLGFRQKAGIDVLVIAISAVLWMQYLNGRL